jgi:hypothetical protein
LPNDHDIRAKSPLPSLLWDIRPFVQETFEKFAAPFICLDRQSHRRQEYKGASSPSVALLTFPLLQPPEIAGGQVLPEFQAINLPDVVLEEQFKAIKALRKVLSLSKLDCSPAATASSMP